MNVAFHKATTKPSVVHFVFLYISLNPFTGGLIVLLHNSGVLEIKVTNGWRHILHQELIPESIVPASKRQSSPTSLHHHHCVWLQNEVLLLNVCVSFYSGCDGSSFHTPFSQRSWKSPRSLWTSHQRPFLSPQPLSFCWVMNWEERPIFLYFFQTFWVALWRPEWAVGFSHPRILLGRPLIVSFSWVMALTLMS